MPNHNGVHHVISEELVKGSAISFCGKKVWKYDLPITLEHAKNCIEAGSYWQPCNKCMNKANKIEEVGL